MNNYYKGYDLSAIQGNVPFQDLANNGTKFIIAKCYEGNKGLDPFYSKNIKGAKDVGILTMGYHFIYPLAKIDPIAQAQLHFKSAAGELCALDLEWPMSTDWKKWGCSASQIVDWTLEYLSEYEELCGIKIPIYTYPNFMETIGNPQQFANYPLWIASYQATPLIPKPWNDWALWQFSGGTEKLPNGVPVDANWAKDLSLWGVTSDPVASPPDNPVVPVQPLPNVPPAQPNNISNLLTNILNIFKK